MSAVNEQYKKFVSAVQIELAKQTKHNKRSIEKMAANFGITNQNLIKELTELAIVMQARILAHKPGSIKSRYSSIVELYTNQVNLSHRTSQSVLLQQYSTPAPIGYLMGVFCGIDKMKTHGITLEPSAGNGLLTIAGYPSQIIVNEIDEVRNNNLKTQGYFGVFKYDATNNLCETIPDLNQFRSTGFDAVITNPPFGNYTTTTIDGVDFTELDHIMSIRALKCLEKNSRAAIIIGGHTQYDAEGRVQAGKNRKFLSYLYKYYNVSDIIPIDGHALYSRQGTAFNTRLILIDGRKATPEGFPPLNKNSKKDILSTFDDLYTRVMQHVQEDQKTTPNNMKLTIAKARAKAIKIKLSLLNNGLGMPYNPASDACFKLDVDVPDSMGFETHSALDRIRTIIGGDVDEFVRIKLAYKTKTELCKALAAEQIDAVAIAIYNIEYLNQGMIIGDQTGIGKGRQAAAIIRYACTQGLQPIFITEKPNLFSDIYRDLKAIGSGALVPYIVNANDTKTKVKDEDGNVVYEPLDATTQKQIIASGKAPSGTNYVMLTYSQISDSSFDKKTGQLLSLSPKASFITQLAYDNIVIMDESHNASGESNTGKVLRDIVQVTKGVVFLSATFAKRADNMPIYALKTAMQDANMSKEALVEAILKGGVALQEVLAAQLVQQGQMLRRERTFEGIEVNYVTLTDKEQEHKAISDNITSILRDIIAFQTEYVMPEVKSLDKIAAATQSQIEIRKGTGKAAVDATPYFSKIFQVVNQMLFAIKAESVADRAIMRLREGKKPVIAFSSTMGSFIEQLKDDFGMKVEDGLKINADFSSVLLKGLDGVLRYTERDSEGKSVFNKFDISEFSPEAQAEYNRISEVINNTSSGIVISPIDFIKQKIEDAGFVVAEVTGRKMEVQLREVNATEKLPEMPKSKGSKNTIPESVKKIMPPLEARTIMANMKGEEGSFFIEMMAQLEASIEVLKKRSLEKEQREWEKNRKDKTQQISYYKEVALPTLHYFNGSSDVYVYEYDDKNELFYTYTILNGDFQNAEFGEMAISELLADYGFGRNFELDLYYTPKPIQTIIDQSYSSVAGLGVAAHNKFKAANITREQNANKAFENKQSSSQPKRYIGLIKPRKKENVFDAFNRFNNNEVDVLMINQSGSTGASAHAIVTNKVPQSQVKQRVMIVLQAELDINREVQKRGRINRTGQIMKPIYDYVSSAVPAEKRFMMMLQKKLKSLDANTTSNQRNSEDLMKSDDFLNKYGDKVVFEYLLENPELNLAIDDPLGKGESDGDSGKKEIPENLASMVSGRVAVLDTKEQEKFYNDVLQRFNKFILLLKAQDEYDLEVETMNLQAKTIESKVVVVGKGGNSPFGDNTILEKCEVNILKKPYTVIEIDNMLQAELQGQTPAQYQAELLRKLQQHFVTKTQNEIADNEAYYTSKIKDIVNEAGYKKLPDNERFQYQLDREEELTEAKVLKAEKIRNTNNNQNTAISEMFSYFVPGKMLYYPVDLTQSEMGKSLAVFIGFEINQNARNPYAPSAIDAKIAIASSKKFIPYPLSRSTELNAIIGASRSTRSMWSDEGKNDWAIAIKENTKDRGVRYILTGNLLQAFAWNELTKPKLVSFTTIDNKVRKGILLSEDWRSTKSDGSDSTQYTIVPIGKAKKAIRSMSENAMILSESGLTIARYNDDFKIMVSRSRQAGGDIFLDKDLLPLVEGNNFNTVSTSMMAIVPANNIDAVCDVLQRKHSISVRLLGWQVELIKDEIESNKYSDEVIVPQQPESHIAEIVKANPNILLVQPNSKLILAKAKAKAIKIKLLLLQNK